jgi:hypothetical protein
VNPAFFDEAQMGPKTPVTEQDFFRDPLREPSSLARWRKRLGEAGVEELLAETIEAAKRAGVIKASSVKRVIVDTTVMEKAIARRALKGD